MQIREWLGYNEDSSQYLLRPGELRVLSNLQSRRAGMLISRSGVRKIYGRYDDEAIFGLYRRATILGDPSDFLWLQRVRQLRELSAEEIEQGVTPWEYVWNVRRLEGDQSRIIDATPFSPGGTTSISNMAVAEDRHGRIFLFYGHGAEPRIYRPGSLAALALPMGMAAPKSAPRVSPAGTGLFIESVDVDHTGGAYSQAPDLVLSGGSPARPAQLKALVSNGNVIGVEVIDGGYDYSEAPEIQVDSDYVGSGFRAKGIVSTSAAIIEGFSSSTAGTVTGTGPVGLQTYGVTNSTQDNYIMYESEDTTSTHKLLAWNYTWSPPATGGRSSIPMPDVSHLSNGDYVWAETLRYGVEYIGRWFQVVQVDYVNNTFWLGDLATGSPVGGSTYRDYDTHTYYFQTSKVLIDSGHTLRVGDPFTLATDVRFDNSGVTVDPPTNSGSSSSTQRVLSGLVPFNSNAYIITEISDDRRVITLDKPYYTNVSDSYKRAGVAPSAAGSSNGFGLAKAVYDSDERRYTAMIPLRSTSTHGQGAKAYLQFSPEPYGYSLDSQSSSSVDVKDTGLNKHYNKIYGEGTDTSKKFQEYLYGNYWGGADFNVPNSTENKLYGGLQASGERFVLGFSGTAGGRSADVYYPDYSKLSVWINTGVDSESESQWSRQDVDVITETDINAEVSLKYIEFQVPPQKSAKTARESGRSQAQTTYKDAEQLPEATNPVVRVYLADCPDSWIVNEAECVPAAEKEKRSNRLAWWSPSSGVPRPLVDLPRDENGEIPLSAVEVVDPGSGWSRGTVFAFRLYQANAYAQYTDYNTAVTEPSVARPHPKYSQTDQYVQFRLTANIGDANTPHGPPHTLIEPAYIGVGGTGYSVGNTGTVKLIKRPFETTGDYTLVGDANYDGQTVSFSAIQLETLGSTSDKRVASITIINKGRNYLSKPTVLVRGGGGGYGLSVDPIVQDGQIDRVRILDNGLGYNSPPELYTSDQPARLTPVMRPAMRGTYRCAYRFADLSETVIKTVTIKKGESSTTLTIDDTTGIEPDMILEGPLLPHYCRVKSVAGDQVEVNQEVLDLPEGHQLLWTANASTAVSTNQVLFLFIESGQVAEAGYTIYSRDELLRLTMQADGNLVMASRSEVDTGEVGYDPVYEYATVEWETGTGGNPGAYAALNEDGQFVIMAADGETVLWTNNVDGAEFVYLESTGAVTAYSGTDYSTAIVRDMTKPISYSDLSPITDVDAGPNSERAASSRMEWLLEGVDPPSRADKVELWRTSADQSLVFYRVESYGMPTANGVSVVGIDNLTDEELFDPGRPHYAALPVVLPNGGLNAFRFGKPRSDVSVAVSYQDRLWMGVSTSGEGANTLYYSEFDEFESCPETNELPIQNNQKSTDVLTALVPFGSILLAMQHTHTYAVQYNTDPAVDATIQMLSHRGVLHQRCWDINENILYAVDESGVYAMSRNGEVRDVSGPVRDFFVSEIIDFSKRETFFLNVDPKTQILRFFTCLKSHATATPSFALCFDIQGRQWWTESYPNSFTAACTGRPDDTRINTILLGAVDGNLYEYSGDADHNNGGLTDTFVDIGGSGYREAPNIRVPNVQGAVAQGVVSEGALVDVIIQNTGWEGSYGLGILAEGGDSDGLPVSGVDGKLVHGAEYAPIKLVIDPPDPGGIQAVAYANFDVTPVVSRIATVSKGESFVRLEKLRVSQFEPEYWTEIATELGQSITAENTAPLRTQPPVVEAGMEAVGDFIPLNAFVSRVHRNDIYLEYPDGSPVEILHGLPRTNEPGTPEDLLEGGGSRILVKFIKPSRTNIPYRLQTGFMEMLNQDNARNGDNLTDRSVTLVYQPTRADKELEIIERMNGRVEMRPNAMRRERGGPASFQHRQDSASTVLNMNREASELGFATGVAKATFAGRSNSDMTGTDRHLQVELYGRPTRASKWDRVNFWLPRPDTPDPQQCVVHSLTVNGVVEENAE